MTRVRLIHWNAAEAKEHANRLASAGYEVVHDVPRGRELLAELRDRPVQAIVIDLLRLPAQGRDVALMLRQFKPTRHVPIVFVGGDPAKVARIHQLLPDTPHTSWSRVRSALRDAIAHPPIAPVVHRSVFAPYAGRPLPGKLGIKAGSTVVLRNAPPGFRAVLGELPEGARVGRAASGRGAIAIWFVRSRSELDRGIPRAVRDAERGPVWIAWPKQGAHVATDLTQQAVRKAGLAGGLVDYKICAIDATWSALAFTRRRG